LRCGLTPEKASVMKFVERHPFADPDVAARKLVEIANAAEAVPQYFFLGGRCRSRKFCWNSARGYAEYPNPAPTPALLRRLAQRKATWGHVLTAVVAHLKAMPPTEGDLFSNDKNIDRRAEQDEEPCHRNSEQQFIAFHSTQPRRHLKTKLAIKGECDGPVTAELDLAQGWAAEGLRR